MNRISCITHRNLLDVGIAATATTTRGRIIRTTRTSLGRGVGRRTAANSRQIHHVGPLLQGLDRSRLYSSAGYEVKLRLAAQILEVSPRREEQVNDFDVVGSELLQRGSRIAGNRDAKDTQLAKLHLVAVEQLLHQAGAGVTDHPFHRTAGKDPVVVRDVLYKLVESHDLGHLVLGIRHLRSLVVQRTFPHESRIINHINCPSSVWGFVLTPAVLGARQR